MPKITTTHAIHVGGTLVNILVAGVLLGTILAHVMPLVAVLLVTGTIGNGIGVMTARLADRSDQSDEAWVQRDALAAYRLIKAGEDMEWTIAPAD